jgi:large subunit ribosomal protein L24
MAATLKVRKGDLVEIVAGKDKGKQGRIIEARPSERRVIIQNLNVAKRHQKPRPMRDATRMGGTQIAPGGVIEKPAPLDVSNVMLVCPVCKRTTRVGYKVVETKGETRKVRVCRRSDCGQEIDS